MLTPAYNDDRETCKKIPKGKINIQISESGRISNLIINFKGNVYLRMIKGEREKPGYLIDRYLFHLDKKNQDGSKILRCHLYQNKKSPCKVSCTIAGRPSEEYYTREPHNQDSSIDINKLHNHEPLSEIEIDYMDCKAIIKTGYGDVNKREIYDEQLNLFIQKWKESNESREYVNSIKSSFAYLIKKNDNPSQLTSCKCKGNCDKRCSCFRNNKKCTSDCSCKEHK